MLPLLGQYIRVFWGAVRLFNSIFVHISYLLQQLENISTFSILIPKEHSASPTLLIPFLFIIHNMSERKVTKAKDKELDNEVNKTFDTANKNKFGFP